MQSFTTQSHQRNYQGNVVVENSQRARTQTKRHKVLSGVATSVMALAVAATGTLLGATALHNRQLKNEIHALQVQAAEVTTYEQSMETMEDMENLEFDEKFFYPTMTLEARPEDTAQPDDEQKTAVKDNEERAPHHDGRRHRRHGAKRALRRVPISDKEHEAQPLPAVEHQRLN